MGRSRTPLPPITEAKIFGIYVTPQEPLTPALDRQEEEAWRGWEKWREEDGTMTTKWFKGDETAGICHYC